MDDLLSLQRLRFSRVGEPLLRSFLQAWRNKTPPARHTPNTPVVELTTHQSSCRGVAMVFLGYLPKHGLGAALLGACLLAAFALPSHVMAQELHSPVPPATSVEEALFWKENEAAMIRRMNDLTINPTGDIDRDFVAMMIPHHRGAIEIAISELRYAKNEQLRRIAQEIIVDEIQEIAAMKRSPVLPTITSHRATRSGPDACR